MTPVTHKMNSKILIQERIRDSIEESMEKPSLVDDLLKELNTKIIIIK